MELLLILIVLLGIGYSLGLWIVFALGALAIIVTILSALVTFFSNFLWLAISLILISLYVLLPTKGFIAVLVGLIVLFVIAWFTADDDAVKADLAKKGIKYKNNAAPIEKFPSKKM